MQDELWKTPVVALKGDQGSPEEMAGVSSRPKTTGLWPYRWPGRGDAAGTPGASGKEMLLLIISQEPECWSQHFPGQRCLLSTSSRRSGTDPSGSLLREGFSHCVVWQRGGEDALET